MKIVLTHVNPDFDAIASAYAACKLHGCDHIAMISNFEPNVYEFLNDMQAYMPIKNYTEREIEEIASVEHLVITDCKQEKRLGKLAALIKKAEQVTIYDHHPVYAQDIFTPDEHVKSYGSCTSIIVPLIKQNNIILNDFEATLLAMGIYEDTGLLTFKNTMPEDADAVSYLLSIGAQTSLIGTYIKRDLNRIQVFILNELLLNLSLISAGGVNVAISYASTDDYIDEIAYIAQRLMTMEGLESLFILVSGGGRIVLVGRSKTSKVDVSSVIGRFGGGGHASAASAIIKDMLLPEAIESVRHAIRDNIRPVKMVAEIMNSPVKYVLSGTLFSEAQDLTMKYNLNHMPVVKDGRAVGIISRKDILDGIKHGLRDVPVNDIMQVEFDRVAPTTPFFTAEEIMVCKGQELLPVEDETGLIGVVTRTDLLRLMHEEITLRTSAAEKARTDLGISRSRNIRPLMKDQLPTSLSDVLETIGQLAEKEGVKAYVVGGFVRDLLMKNTNFDIDIVVEGDAPRLAHLYAKKVGGKVSVHAKFKTAVLTLADGFKIDFATARTEYYMTPAAAPEVEEASIKNDLFRRDFSINAMAVRLDGAQYGSLLDFFSGQRDINEKKVRALHSLSFVDDPSRAFRAIRFAVRFSFDIGLHTERLIKHAEGLDLFGHILGLRLFLELKYILGERGYLTAIQLMKKYNLLRFYCKGMTVDKDTVERFERLEELINWYNIQVGTDIESWMPRFAVLFSKCDPEEYTAMLAKFELSSKMCNELAEMRKYMDYAAIALRRNKEHPPSFVSRLCSQFSREGLLALGAVYAPCKEMVKHYITEYAFIEPELDGNSLIALGVPKGPQIKLLLEQLKNAKLDGVVRTKEDEETFVKTKCGETETK